MKNEPVRVVKAVELFKDGKPLKIRVVLWEDGHVTLCSNYDGGKCYTTDSDPTMFYRIQAFYASPELGFKVKSLEV
ncbi:MAG: hypothetical protein JRD89_00795 [Deltaproteobacteria bacterium]|nr:hypothetical protein [Deltaproteobacteria bacterium]